MFKIRSFLPFLVHDLSNVHCPAAFPDRRAQMTEESVRLFSNATCDSSEENDNLLGSSQDFDTGRSMSRIRLAIWFLTILCDAVRTNLWIWDGRSTKFAIGRG